MSFFVRPTLHLRVSNFVIVNVRASVTAQTN